MSSINTFPIIYKRNSNGNINQWQIFVEDNKFYTIEGVVNGKLTQSKPTICVGKNIGKKNETTDHEQALKQATAKLTKKLESGYTKNIKQVDTCETYYSPMLAHKLMDYIKKLDYVNDQLTVQRKSDGCRAIITKNGAFSRNGKPWVAVPHILKALKPFFTTHPDAILDGELYCHDLNEDFNKIVSLVKKQKPTKSDLIQAEKYIQYHIYDCPRIDHYTEGKPFLTRFNQLKSVLKSNGIIKFVDTYPIKTEQDIWAYHEKFVSEGYEGIIVRLNASYENKRSKHLLKYKHFETEEYIIRNIREGDGNKTNMAAHADFDLANGEEFTTNIKGSHEWLKELWINRKQVIGKHGTVRFPNYTPAGKPRFGYLIAIRDYE